MIATVAALPAFPDKIFYTNLLVETQINRQCGLK